MISALQCWVQMMNRALNSLTDAIIHCVSIIIYIHEFYWKVNNNKLVAAVCCQYPLSHVFGWCVKHRPECSKIHTYAYIDAANKHAHQTHSSIKWNHNVNKQQRDDGLYESIGFQAAKYKDEQSHKRTIVIERWSKREAKKPFGGCISFVYF